MITMLSFRSQNCNIRRSSITKHLTHQKKNKIKTNRINRYRKNKKIKKRDLKTFGRFES